ncbi:MAG: VOC family protein [Clostridiaceae bacterium]|jgi:catechol 2,3-dioxygenase-like lactoylglutathione lyase family enzyme|nr:VOC family protein [Clostridiaceae bacterium]
MDKKILGTNIVTQVAFVVNDIEKTSQAYADFLGMDKPEIKITKEYDQVKTVYKGKPSTTRAKLAFFHLTPNLAIELIEPDAEKSVWRDVLEENGEGFHHIAFVVENTDEVIARLEKNNMPLIQRANNYAYVDATEELKTIIELLW